MAQNKDLFDKLSEMPKGKLLAIAAVVLIILGVPAVYYGFGLNKKPAPEEDSPGSVVIDMPDPEVDEYNRTRLQGYQDVEMQKKMNGSGGGNDYWDSLGDDLVNARDGEHGDDYLDPAIYSKTDIYYIRNGIKTKAQIDREHADAAAEQERMRQIVEGGGSSYGGYQQQRPLTQAQQDSIYFARLERSYQLANKYSAQQTAAPAYVPQSQPEPEPEPEPEKPEERTIDLGQGRSSLPSGSFSDDGIITSLVGPEDSDVVRYAGTVHSKPVKATFLKNETITNGQRVIIRLMEDMELSNGTTIPANTHITGTCTFSSRLRIDVKMLHYNGRMFPTDISAYDNDGTEGIYCPTVESSKKNRNKAKQVASDAVSAVGTVAGTLLTGNPFIGRVATSGLQAATSSINDDGSVSVKVMSGYEFYVFENVKSN